MESFFVLIFAVFIGFKTIFQRFITAHAQKRLFTLLRYDAKRFADPKNLYVRDIVTKLRHLMPFSSDFSLRMRRNDYPGNSYWKTDDAIRFSDPENLYVQDIVTILRHLMPFSFSSDFSLHMRRNERLSR